MTDAQIALSHLADDAERTRTRALRTLRAQVDMLLDAQHALSAGNFDVTTEFLDRVTIALTREIANLVADAG